MSGSDTPASSDKPEPRIGSYRLMNPLGTGGMSSVFRALHAETDVEVAVKILPRTLARNPATLQRFIREAKSAEALEHPNIVAIYDRGVDEGKYYLVLEYVHGGDLHDRVRSKGPMPIAEAVSAIRTVAEGLRYAAGQGVIHRDIKPANLLVNTAGEVKITDLGLALQSAEEDERVTREGTTVGTVDYMSPEQARDSRATSVRSDIYSLGCTFFFLLTGQPPYTGGDVAEKLTKHCTSPPVDPRGLRPEVSPALARLVMKMMAKRPENRFADYDQLIAALDALNLAPADAAAPLDVLIVDDDDEGPDSAVLLTVAEPPGPTRSGAKGPKAKPPSAAPRDEVSMADLAELDEAPVPAPRRSDRPPSAVEAQAQVPIRRGEGLAPHAIFDDEDDEEAFAGAMPAAVGGGSRKMTAAERSWVTALVLGGLGLIVLVIAVDQLIKASTTTEVVPAATEEFAGVPEEVVPPPATPPRPPLAVANVPGVTKAVSRTPPETTRSPTSPAATSPTPAPTPETIPVEPSEPVAEVAPEVTFGAAVEARYRPDWASGEVVTRLPGKLTTVRRVPDLSDPDQKSSIHAALSVSGGGTVEIADDGPFFESDLHFGEARVVRARQGFRPVVCLRPPKSETAGGASAFLDLGGRSLTLDGLDLIVDIGELPRSQSALFLCGGGTLTLQNCSLTVVNANGYPFSILATKASEKASRIRLERCTVRGSFIALADLAAGAAEVVVSRSVVLTGQGVGFMLAGSPTATRALWLIRSVVATRGPMVEFSDAPGGSKPRPLTVKALGTTFAHFRTPARASLMTWRGSGAGLADMVTWQGDHNQLSGWSDWFSVGPSHAVRVSDLSAARSVWPGSDPASTEAAEPWPSPQAADRIVPDDLRALAPARADVLTRAARPTPYLREKTIGAFPKVVVPDVANAATGPAAFSTPVARGPLRSGMVTQGPASTGGIARGQPGRANGLDVAPEGRLPTGYYRGSAGSGGSAGLAAGERPVPPGIRVVSFDAEAVAWRGDLGRFLSETVRPDDRVVRVVASGSTPHEWSPFRVPDGVSLEIVVAPDTGGRAPSWTAAEGREADALIEVRQATLWMEGVRLTRDGSAALKHLIRVERGHLVLQNCVLRGPGRVEPGGGALIAFVAPGTVPIRSPLETAPKAAVVTPPPPPRFSPGAAPKRPPVAAKPKAAPGWVPDPWPFVALVNRPTCRVSDSVLVTGGDVLHADLGRGLTAFRDCVVASGATAFRLSPSNVARSRFDADLVIDRCSVAAERVFVGLGRWPGNDPGPDRPWLVSTQYGAFFGLYEKPESPSVLLLAEDDALAHSSLFWQATGDAFEVPVFAANGNKAASLGGTGPRRADVVHQWIDLWGESHFRNVSGPRGPLATASTRPVVRLRPGDVEPGDLAVDPSFPPGRTHHAVGADFARLGIVPETRGARGR